MLLLLAGLARPACAQTFDPRSAVPPDSLHATLEALPARPDSLRERFDQERLLHRLQAYSRRKTIMGRAMSGLLNFTQRQQEQAGLDAVLLDRQFDRHNFKIVRRIDIRPLDAFGYSLTDSTRRPRTLLDKAGNGLHIKTSRARIRQVLLFRPGQALEPQALAESERLLRQTPEILDARVLVNERTTTRDSVDIEVLTTDVFSITAGVQVGTATAGTITLGDQNFLGLGHQIENSYNYGREYDNTTNPQTWAYEGSYTAPFRHFFYAQGRYRNEFNYRSGGVSLRRDFYSPTTRYAGAISLDRYTQQFKLSTPQGLTPRYYPLESTVQDAWIGRALRLRSYDLGYENPGRIIVATRMVRTQFQTVPDPAPVEVPNYVNSYHNSTLLLGTVGYSVRRYYKDRYLFGFGRTEDIPTGTLVSFTAGYDINSVVPHHYFDVRIAAAGYSARTGYLYGALDVGGYQRLDEGRRWEQGLLTGELTSFTRLYHRGNWQYRHFLSSRATIGLNRRPGDFLQQGITNDRGLRGFSPASPIRATSRFVLNYETTLFTPLSLLGFRLAGIAFADAAWVTERPGGGSPFDGAPYTGFGLGLRFRNEFTVLRTFQLLLGYYPRGLNAANGIKMYESTRETITFSDFGLGSPGVPVYQ
ncbi:BamA/TamA family outer membrane protein [Hymenobacter agri]